MTTNHPVPTPPPSEPAPSLRPVEELFEQAERWLHQCGFCDFGLAKDCTCPRGDFRNVIADMLARLRAAEETLAAVGALCDEFDALGSRFDATMDTQLHEAVDRAYAHAAWRLRAALAEGASR